MEEHPEQYNLIPSPFYVPDFYVPMKHKKWDGDIHRLKPEIRRKKKESKHHKNTIRRNNLINRIATRDGGKFCFYCKKELKNEEVTFDHFIPKSLGGSNAIYNLRLACGACNHDKANKHPLSL